MKPDIRNLNWLSYQVGLPSAIILVTLTLFVHKIFVACKETLTQCLGGYGHALIRHLESESLTVTWPLEITPPSLSTAGHPWQHFLGLLQVSWASRVYGALCFSCWRGWCCGYCCSSKQAISGSSILSAGSLYSHQDSPLDSSLMCSSGLSSMAWYTSTKVKKNSMYGMAATLMLIGLAVTVGPCSRHVGCLLRLYMKHRSVCVYWSWVALEPGLQSAVTCVLACLLQHCGT